MCSTLPLQSFLTPFHFLSHSLIVVILLRVSKVYQSYSLSFHPRVYAPQTIFCPSNCLFLVSLSLLVWVGWRQESAAFYLCLIFNLKYYLTTPFSQSKYPSRKLFSFFVLSIRLVNVGFSAEWILILTCVRLFYSIRIFWGIDAKIMTVNHYTRMLTIFHAPLELLCWTHTRKTW